MFLKICPQRRKVCISESFLLNFLVYAEKGRGGGVQPHVRFFALMDFILEFHYRTRGKQIYMIYYVCLPTIVPVK